MIRQEKKESLQKRMEVLGIKEEDLIEKFILGSGSGGQKINKTSSCVYLKHLPTGLEVKCQKDRSRELNRYYARLELCDQIDEKINKVKTERQQLIEKKRRQKRRRSKKAQEKVLSNKKVHSAKKAMRHSPKSVD